MHPEAKEQHQFFSQILVLEQYVILVLSGHSTWFNNHKLIWANLRIELVIPVFQTSALPMSELVCCPTSLVLHANPYPTPFVGAFLFNAGLNRLYKPGWSINQMLWPSAVTEGKIVLEWYLSLITLVIPKPGNPNTVVDPSWPPTVAQWKCLSLCWLRPATLCCQDLILHPGHNWVYQ